MRIIHHTVADLETEIVNLCGQIRPIQKRSGKVLLEVSLLLVLKPKQCE